MSKSYIMQQIKAGNITYFSIVTGCIEIFIFSLFMTLAIGCVSLDRQKDAVILFFALIICALIKSWPEHRR